MMVWAHILLLPALLALWGGNASMEEKWAQSLGEMAKNVSLIPSDCVHGELVVVTMANSYNW